MAFQRMASLIFDHRLECNHQILVFYAKIYLNNSFLINCTCKNLTNHVID